MFNLFTLTFQNPKPFETDNPDSLLRNNSKSFTGRQATSWTTIRQIERNIINDGSRQNRQNNLSGKTPSHIPINSPTKLIVTNLLHEIRSNYFSLNSSCSTKLAKCFSIIITSTIGPRRQDCECPRDIFSCTIFINNFLIEFKEILAQKRNKNNRKEPSTIVVHSNKILKDLLNCSDSVQNERLPCSHLRHVKNTISFTIRRKIAEFKENCASIILQTTQKNNFRKSSLFHTISQSTEPQITVSFRSITRRTVTFDNWVFL